MATRLQLIEQDLTSLRDRFTKAQGKRDLVEQQLRQKEADLVLARGDIKTWQQTQVLLSKVAEFAREQLKLHIEKTVTAGMQAAFEDDSSFIVKMTSYDNKPAAKWLVSTKHSVSGKDGSDGKDVSDGSDMGSVSTCVTNNPEEGDGGGATDIVSLALRMAVLELGRPKPGGGLFLDEPGKMLDKQTSLLENTAEFIKQYLRHTGRQGLMITHHDPLAQIADVSYRCQKVNGVSEVARNV